MPLFRQDLRIGNAIIPTHYFVELDVDVRGYNGAEKSTFSGKKCSKKCDRDRIISGKVTIDLNIAKAVRGIELHAVGLDIGEVQKFGGLRPLRLQFRPQSLLPTPTNCSELPAIE